jgi:predicted dehydrogenase
MGLFLIGGKILMMNKLNDKIGKKYKSILVGAGRFGMYLSDDDKRLKPATHFELLSTDSRTELLGVCDINQSSLERAQSILPDIQVSENIDVLLREIKPEIVSIASWKENHFEMINKCIDHHVKAILCEKPIATNLDDCIALKNKLNKSNSKLLINHRRRFDELLYEVVELLNGGRIGELMQGSANYVYGLLSTGTHLIDTLRFFLKDICGEIKWVSAYPNQFKHFSPDNDSCLDGIICFENNFKISIHSSDLKDYDIYNINLYGRKGMMSFKNIGRDIEFYDVIDSPEHTGFTELSPVPTLRLGGKPRNQFKFMLDNAIDCIENNAKPLGDADDAIIALKVLFAMKESAANKGRMVDLKI